MLVIGSGGFEGARGHGEVGSFCDATQTLVVEGQAGSRRAGLAGWLAGWLGKQKQARGWWKWRRSRDRAKAGWREETWCGLSCVRSFVRSFFRSFVWTDWARGELAWMGWDGMYE